MAEETKETPAEDTLTKPEEPATETLIQLEEPAKEADNTTMDDIPKLPDAPLIPLKNIPTLLGELKERCITVCLDTSGSMYKCIDAVKEHVIEALVQKANSDPEAMFNVMEFSTGVTQWADRLVRCTPQTVAVAAQWINSLSATTGTDTLDALLTAFADPVCDAVYLITDGLPDKPTSEILDHVAYASNNRPVHCYFIQSSEPDSAATDFLQDLAAETFGSFHVITVTEHGAIEQITPVYHAEATPHPSVIRSTNGTIYTNDKYVTVGATLDTVPDIHVVRPPVSVGAPPVTVYAPTPPTIGLPPPVHYYPWHPYSPYYFPHYPQYGWSRYRPARAWGTRTEQMVNTSGELGVAPGAGVLLVGQKVLVRRHQDGFYYIGTVKSQIFEDKFLVEIGPCKHGKYKDSIFQETYVYDIIAHVDALRHTILTGDKVLAPMEPDGERYSPGVVIDGQEKRYAEGNTTDRDLTVTFHNNGGTEKIPRGLAVWIPSALHDRITFEQQLPAKVRREMATKERYPNDNWPGYPTSGPVGQPREYDKFEPVYVEKTDDTLERGLYKSPYYVPLYPTWYNNGARPSAVTSEEIDALIPGTDFTKSQLNEKVMSQLMEHKMTLDGSTKELVEENQEDQRLLKKREQFQDKSILKESRKSVTFQDLSDAEAEADPDDLDTRDSGHGSSNDLLYDSDFDLDYDYEYKPKEKSRSRTRDRGVGTDWRGHVMHTRRRSRSLSPSRRSRSVSPDKRPPWRYWGNDPAPDIIDPPSHEPYDQTYTPTPIEVREALRGKHGVEWTSSHTKVVDPYAKHRYDRSVRDSLYIPKPPPRDPPEKQGPGEDISEILGARMSEQIRREEFRKDFKRNQALKRQRAWNEKLAEEMNQQQQMDDQNRGVVSSRIERHRQRVQEEHDKQQLRQDVKRALQRRTHERLAEYCDAGRDREERKYEAMRARRELREAAYAARQREVEEGLAKRQFVRESQAQSLWQQHQAHLNNEEARELAREQQCQRAKINRIRHFRALEREGQRRKDLQAEVADQKSGILRSQIFP